MGDQHIEKIFCHSWCHFYKEKAIVIVMLSMLRRA